MLVSVAVLRSENLDSELGGPGWYGWVLDVQGRPVRAEVPACGRTVEAHRRTARGNPLQPEVRQAARPFCRVPQYPPRLDLVGEIGGRLGHGDSERAQAVGETVRERVTVEIADRGGVDARGCSKRHHRDSASQRPVH